MASGLLGALFDFAISRAAVIATHYGLRHDFHAAIETYYREDRSEGFLL